MRIKYVIHRGKKPFAKEKELFRKIVNFYTEQYPRLRFVDRGLRFSAEYEDIDIEFDFGYQNMRYRDFSGYHHVISQSCCSLLGPELNPGAILLPDSADMMRINTAATKVRVYARSAQYENPMNAVFSELLEYEKSIDSSELGKFVSKELGASKKVGTLKDLQVKQNAAMVESNTFFQPSRFKKVDAVLKVGEERLPIKDVREHLEGRFDGVNCEAKQMIENAGSRLLMFAIGTDKPYDGLEQLKPDKRFGTDIESAAKTYNHGNISYFLTLFFGYCMSRGFRLTDDVQAAEQTPAQRTVAITF